MESLDPSLPSSLMPLVCPYLSYEDTVRCMQLNSNFNRYIDNNWKDMTKKEICIKISKRFDYSENILILECGEYLEVDNKYRPAGDNTTIFEIKDTILDVNLDNLAPCMQAYLEKNAHLNAEFMENREYTIENTAHGLKLVMDALVLRFAIRQFRMKYFDSTHDKEDFEVIKKCLSNYYQSTSGPMEVSFKGRGYQEYVMDIADGIDALIVFATFLRGSDQPNSTISFGSDAMSALGKSKDIYKTLKKWLDGHRTIENITMNFEHTVYKAEHWRREFEELAGTLGIEHIHKEEGDNCTSSCFEIQRTDGEVLEVEIQDPPRMVEEFLSKHLTQSEQITLENGRIVTFSIENRQIGLRYAIDVLLRRFNLGQFQMQTIDHDDRCDFQQTDLEDLKLLFPMYQPRRSPKAQTIFRVQCLQQAYIDIAEAIGAKTAAFCWFDKNPVLISPYDLSVLPIELYLACWDTADVADIIKGWSRGEREINNLQIRTQIKDSDAHDYNHGEAKEIEITEAMREQFKDLTELIGVPQSYENSHTADRKDGKALAISLEVEYDNPFFNLVLTISTQ